MASQRQDVSPRLEGRDGWRGGGMDGGREAGSASYETSNFTWLAVATRSCTRLLAADLMAECRGRAAARATAQQPRRKKKEEEIRPTPPLPTLPYAALAVHTVVARLRLQESERPALSGTPR